MKPKARAQLEVLLHALVGEQLGEAAHRLLVAPGAEPEGGDQHRREAEGQQQPEPLRAEVDHPVADGRPTSR